MSDIWILYQTTNLVNGKIYVGVHKVADNATSRCYLGSGNAIKVAVKKYGRENFTRTTLAEFTCAEDAYEAEANMVTEEFISRKNTYNMKTGGIGYRGILHTPESRARMSAAQKERFLNLTEEDRAKLKAAHMGKVVSEETRAKQSAAKKGRKLSEETRAKISEAGKGRIFTEETRDKLRGNKWNVGRHPSEETKIKRSLNSPKSIPVVINGKYHISGRQAAKFEKVSFRAVQGRLKSPNPKWLEWRLATKEEIANFLLEGGLEG